MKLSTLKQLAGMAAVSCLFATSGSAATIAHLLGSDANADANLMHVAGDGDVTPGDGADSYVAVDVATLNGMTPAEMAAAYDVLVVPWVVDGTADLDWTTRLLPYLEAGGGILWEDPGNLDDLAASGITFGGSYGPGVDPSGSIFLDPPFGDLGAEGYFHVHFVIDTFTADWTCWSTDINGDCHGLYGEFGTSGGRMVIGVSDNLFHPLFSSGADDDHERLTVNQLNWILSGSITGVPDDKGIIPLPATSILLLGGMGALIGLRRRKKS